MTAECKLLSEGLAGIVASAAPSLVAVDSHHMQSAGFVWRPGFVVTADEALADEGEVHVTTAGGERVQARIAGRDPSTDIALLSIEGSQIAPLALLTDVLPAGSLAIAAGSREGAPVCAAGIVAYAGPAWKSLRGGDIDARIELDLRLAGQAEGSVAMDAQGRVFGMAVLAPRRRVLVIPTATIERVAIMLMNHGRIRRGYLGLSLQPVAATDGGAGAIVMNVDPKGPAVAAGIHQGDVIVSWDGKPVTRLHSLMRSLGPDSVDRKIDCEIRRGGQIQQVVLTVGERPAE